MSSIQVHLSLPLFEEARDKVVVLTGGATGIGAATVRLLTELGASVAFLDTNKAAGERLASELGEKVTFHPGSVSSWDDQVALFDATLAKHGRIDIVAANAGIDEVAEDVFTDTYDEQGKLKSPTLVVLDVNLKGAIYSTKLALSYFRKHGIRGSIVLTGSAASYLDTPGIPVYNASKHGVIGLVRSLRDTLRGEGLVRANVVAPWFTETAFTRALAPTWREQGLPVNTPAQVAQAIVYLALNSEYNGKSIYVANGEYTELEDAVQSSRSVWLGSQNTSWIDQRKAANIKLGRQD